MINKEKIQVYINAMLESFDEKSEVGTAYDAIREDYGMEDVSDEDIREAIRDEMEIKAEENILEFGEPELTIDELSYIFTKIATRLALESLMEKGMIQVKLDPEQGENVYALTEKGRAAGKFLF
jgi:predicted transcriptional regulator